MRRKALGATSIGASGRCKPSKGAAGPVVAEASEISTVRMGSAEGGKSMVGVGLSRRDGTASWPPRTALV